MTTELTPEFTTSLRGYDRIQVDDYVDTLREWLDAATARMQAAEADASQLREQTMRLRQRVAELEADADQEPPRSLNALGDRIARMLALADESAQAVQAGAESAAAELVTQAQADAEELIRSTRARQAEIEAWLSQTTRQADQLVAQAEERAALAAAQLTSDAEARAAATAAMAEQRAQELIARAESDAAELTDAAEADRARTLHELAAKREELTGHIRSLEAQRDEVLAALTGLRESLHRTIGHLPSAAAANPPAANPPAAAQPAEEADRATAAADEPLDLTEASAAGRPDETLLFDQNEVQETAGSQ
jgi:cell division septum initiation protein DivIVA